MRIAATADVHARAREPGAEERIRALFANVARDADVLVLAGDLTDHGRAAEAETLLRGLDGVGVPIVAVLGNHDHESGQPAHLARMLRSAGWHVLDREHDLTLDGVGFAGVKGFCGGFDPMIVRGFGEDALKAFVAESVVEAEALRARLRALESRLARVAVTHYAPVCGTVEGEPREIHPFLGTTRLAKAIDEGGARLALHGHAHHGAHAGSTPGGIPVRNVSLPVLRARGAAHGYEVFEVAEPPRAPLAGAP
jgi:Icc-related predicted phosphoesterase